METGGQHGQDEGWGVQGEEWTRLHSLLELVKREHRMEELNPERREQIRERVLERLDQIEARRHKVRVVLTGATGLLLAGLLLAVVIRATNS